MSSTALRRESCAVELSVTIWRIAASAPAGARSASALATLMPAAVRAASYSPRAVEHQGGRSLQNAEVCCKVKPVSEVDLEVAARDVR